LAISIGIVLVGLPLALIGGERFDVAFDEHLGDSLEIALKDFIASLQDDKGAWHEGLESVTS
jgi:hypothetical protein